MTEHDNVIVTVPEAIEEYRRGKFVIITDDEDRENEGDLTIAAQFVTPDTINFMAKYGRGLICVPLTEDRCDDLKMPLMVDGNTSHFGTPFTVPVEARTGVTTGISAPDRARTVQVLIDPRSGPDDIVRPGHMFRCGRARAVCSCGQDRRRRAWTSARWRGYTRRRSSARS
jgi:3,4-dihydroxy 2-butanone 4-phosphate synthase/GTP cyclohydrolase II